MQSTSFAFRRQMADNTKVALKATLTFADGTVRELTGEDFAMGGISVTTATSTTGSFDIGAAVMGSCEVTLANYDQRFDVCDFTGATIVPWCGVEFADGTMEWLRLGIFGVEQPDSYGSTIGLHCLDNLRLLEEVDYADVLTAYPASLGRIAYDIATACGLVLSEATFPNADYVVATRPTGDLTCLDVMAHAAQAAGCFLVCDVLGRPLFAWYDTSVYETEDWLDGGSFDGDETPYADGDVADGGGFMTGGDEYDGGGFVEAPWATFTAYTSLTVSTDDVLVTGVSVTASAEATEDGTMGGEGEESLYGTAGYVLSVSDNPLIEYGRASEVAQRIGPMAVGMRFRPFSASGIASPAWQAGDPVLVIDGRQRTYISWLTSYTWKAGGYASLACDAETPARNLVSKHLGETQAIVELRNAVRAEKTAREEATADLAEALAESSGLYMTQEPQQDGSTIYYMHDKATLAESTIVWKLTANALGISTDGGRTYPYGLDATGTAILQRIYAIGINADYINAGTLSSQNGAFSLDLLTGLASISSTSELAGRTIEEILDDVNATISEVAVEYARGATSTTPPTTGWSTTAPEWQAGSYIWQRTKTVTPSGTTYSDPTCISGRDGVDGTDGTSVTVSAIEYAVGSSSTAPSSGWQSTVPTLPQGSWLWVRTTYSDTTVSYTKAYAGTDGDDGTSVAIQSATKSGGVTTVVLACSDGSTTTLTITDGDDGTDGTPGLSGYVHTAWATSADGSQGFSTTVSEGKTYLGVYTDNAATDSQVYTDYSWSLIKGADGTDGADGTSVTVSSVDYAAGTSGTVAPSSGWQSSIPSVAQGGWLWVRVTYSDSTTALTCSYQGSDGEDGTSVAIQSATKTGDTTTVVITDGTTTSTLTIQDGEDGTNGTNGASGYVHTAWANSSDGTVDFSTSVSAGKTYLGVYTDHTQADSTTPSDYSWSLIKGADGTDGVDGDDGVGVSNIVEQYYLSTSTSTQTGGSWGTSQPAWSSGHYIWTRSQVTWSDGGVTYTTPVLAQAINGANETASDADDKATKLATMVRQYGSGVLVCRQGNTVGALVNADGSFDVVKVTWSAAGVPTAGQAMWRGSTDGTYIYNSSGGIIGQFTASGIVVGLSTDTHVVIGSGGLELYCHPGEDVLMAHLGYGSVQNQSGNLTNGAYFDLGFRKSGSTIGLRSVVLNGGDSTNSGNEASGALSVAHGISSTASGNFSMAGGVNANATGYAAHAEGADTYARGTTAHAEGNSTEADGYAAHVEGCYSTYTSGTIHSNTGCEATGDGSHAENLSCVASGDGAHAEGELTVASGQGAHAEGFDTTASGDYSHAGGRGTIASSAYQVALGKYNAAMSSSYNLVIGNGTSDSNRKTSFYVQGSVCHASIFDTSSDRRLKEHVAYLGEDAEEFVRSLRPALFVKDGANRVGFYAQDVQASDPWDTDMVRGAETGELEGPVLGLDYQALIAPLVAYAQGLERRIDDLEARLKALEGGS